MSSIALPAALVGDGLQVPCADGTERPHLSFDASASTSALPQVMQAVEAFVPRYAGVHHGTGYKSQASALAFSNAHLAALAFAGRDADSDDVAVICRNTTEAINHLAYRLRLGVGDIVVTTVAEHYSNLTGVSVGTVKSSLHRGRRQLRTRLAATRQRGAALLIVAYGHAGRTLATIPLLEAETVVSSRTRLSRTSVRSVQPGR